VTSPGFPILLTVSIREHSGTLSIGNVSIPASLHLFHNLKNLHVDLSQACNGWPATMRRLIAILNVSPRLEVLSLGYIGPNVSLHGDKRSKRVAAIFPLKSLALAAPASEVMSVMDHLNLPSIASLTLDLSGLQPSHFHLSQTTFSRTVHLKTPQNSHISLNRAQSGWGLRLACGATEHWEEMKRSPF